ncbi:hypothetical protein ACLOJK_004830 [Asimina triloba]
MFELENLQVLMLFNNRLEGSILEQIDRMSKLRELSLYNNSLSGQIPVRVSHLRKLSYLSLAYNNLSGEVPSDLGKNTPLETLDFTGNHFYGQVPPHLCAAKRLSVLDLGFNHFDGKFPVEIGQCASLSRIILRNNLLRGCFPSNLTQKGIISFVDVSGNLLEGSIPPSLCRWTSLLMLDVSDNLLSGPIPPELGTIPPELGNYKSLIKLDLSRNHLSGSIPSAIANCTNLQSLLLQENEFTGEIPNSLSFLQSLFELHLRSNMLGGSIPYSVGNLRQLSLILNLSSNRLSGGIPSSLGNLDKLQILDLSNNHISGRIPSQLNNMASPSFVNISFNGLSGELPATWMKLLSIWPTSFLGNPKLCIKGFETSHCKNAEYRYKAMEVFVALMTGMVFFVIGLCCLVYSLVMQGMSPVGWAPLQYIVPVVESKEELPRNLRFQDIMLATEGLNEKYVIGRGRHGTVYRAELNEKVWAVKRLDLSEVGFSHELETLSMVRHRNLVRMAGYCIRDGFGFIMYEYIPGGTLFEVLHQRNPCIALRWKVRHRIALGIAQGLSYLHHDSVPRIIHRDIKSNNVLLDSDMEPKIGDFAMAKMKADVYSYGVVLLELLCRKVPVDQQYEYGLDIVSWINKNLQSSHGRSPLHFLDEEIWFWMEDEKSKALELLRLALSCTRWAFDARPSMREVVSSLLELDGGIKDKRL